MVWKCGHNQRVEMVLVWNGARQRAATVFPSKAMQDLVRGSFSSLGLPSLEVSPLPPSPRACRPSTGGVSRRRRMPHCDRQQGILCSAAVSGELLPSSPLSKNVAAASRSSGARLSPPASGTGSGIRGAASSSPHGAAPGDPRGAASIGTQGAASSSPRDTASSSPLGATPGSPRGAGVDHREPSDVDHSLEPFAGLVRDKKFFCTQCGKCCTGEGEVRKGGRDP